MFAAHEKAIIEEPPRATGGRIFGPSGAAARLEIETRLLRREIGLLSTVGAVPPLEQLREGTSLN